MQFKLTNMEGGEVLVEMKGIPYSTIKKIWKKIEKMSQATEGEAVVTTYLDYILSVIAENSNVTVEQLEELPSDEVEKLKEYLESKATKAVSFMKPLQK